MRCGFIRGTESPPAAPSPPSPSPLSRPPPPRRQVAVFVDPLDGTREFVEGRFQAVSSVVGISVRGRAVAGVIGLPFNADTGMEPQTANIAIIAS